MTNIFHFNIISNYVKKPLPLMVTKTKKRIPVGSLREPINVANLKELAQRKMAGRVCWPGWSVSIREVVQSYIAREVDGYITTKWFESNTPFPTRQYSGGNDGSDGRSLFTLPRLLKSIGRAGLNNCVDLDQSNAHYYGQRERHPFKPALGHYINNKANVRA